MKVTDILNQAKKPVFSFEVLPPLKGETIQNLFDNIAPLMEFNPPLINVTYHREEVQYKRLESGLLQQKVIRKRPGTVGICAAIMNKFHVEAVPHILCGGFSKEDTENALIDLDFLGIENVMALRGDALKGDHYFVPEAQGNVYASDLVKQVVSMNKGEYLDDELQNAHPTKFCIGVAGYPEKHFEAPSLNIDIQYLKQKVEAGADYIVTQLFFDNQKFFDFVKRCREAGITVPILPGIKPIATKKQVTLLPNRFNVDIPDELAMAIIGCKNNQEAWKVGVEWSVKQSKELLANGVPGIHYYSMGKSENIKAIAKEVF